MFDSAILILLYGKEVTDSSTIKALIGLNKSLNNSKVIIWNNGPKVLSKSDLSYLGFEFEVFETISNKSLSVIYNTFISKVKAEKYIILDDDSEISSGYIKEALSLSCKDVGMPIISCNSNIMYPITNGKPIKEKVLTEFGGQPILTIGSGLVIGSEVAQIIKDNFENIFDENFYFYGVDFTFCLRLSLLNLNSNIKIIGGFEHKLSKLEVESIARTQFRMIERSYDCGLQLRYYNSKFIGVLKLFKFILKYLLNSLLRKENKLSLRLVLKAFITGRHYNNKKVNQ